MTETIAHSKRGAQKRDRAVATSGRWAIRLSTVVVAVALLFSLAVGVGFVGTAAAGPTCDGSDDDFAGGDGSSGEPYQIETVEQLQCVGDDANLDDHFVLIDDIDASDTENWNDGNGFEPIGFTGTFDGNGNVIEGLYIDRNTDDVGLFSGDGDRNVVIEDIRLESVNITGNDHTAGLAGGFFGADRVSNVSVSGQIEGSDDYTGGLMSRPMNVDMDERNVFRGEITSSADYIGGLVGRTSGDTEIGESYVQANITVTDEGGSDGVGLLMGYTSSQTSTFDDLYAAGNITDQSSSAQIGAIAGDTDDDDEFNNIYWDKTLSVPEGDGVEAAFGDDGDGISESESENITGFETVEMQGESAEDNLAFDFENTWQTVPGDYPVFQWQADAADAADELDAQDTTWVPDVEGEITVVATEFGVPVEGETISVDDDGGLSGLDETDIATTDENGEATFTFEESDTGDYDLEFEAEDGSVTDTATVSIQLYANDEQPYEIENWYHLDNVRENLGADFELVADLDEETAGYDDVASETADDGDGFDPIGGTFSGTFDGNGYSIEGLTVARPTMDKAGLFAEAQGSGVEIRNLRLVEVDITGETDVGGVVGLFDGQVIDNVSVEGSVHADGEGGTITGDFDGATAAMITGSTGCDQDVNFDEVAAVGTVSTDPDATDDTLAAGLVGATACDVSVSTAYAQVTIADASLGGGAIGWTSNVSSTYERLYATPRFQNVETTGAVVAEIGSGADHEFKDSVYYNDSTRDAVGNDFGDDTVERNWQGLPTDDMRGSSAETAMDNLDFENRWQTVASDFPVFQWQADAADGDEVENIEALDVDIEPNAAGELTVVATDEFGNAIEDEEIEVEDDSELGTLEAGQTETTDENGEATFDFETGEQSEYTPEFSADDESITDIATVTLMYAAGEGTDTNPYEIEDWYHLDNVRENLDDEFVLIADLDEETDGYDDVVTDPENGFEPIEGFTGTFDGNGHEIADLVIDRPDKSGVGLFGDNDGLIKNVAVTDADITGDNVQVGGLVGMNQGEVVDSHATGAVIGDDDVGGLVGLNHGDITSSFATADVTGDGGVGGLIGLNQGDIAASFAKGDVEGNLSGGLVGNNHGTVSESYATGAVTGNNDLGGLVGFNNNGEITSSYATGTVTGDERVGGLVGLNEGEIVDSESHWDTESTEQMDGIGDGPGGAVGLETAEMQGDAAEANMDGFDFEDTWQTVSGDYPMFQWQAAAAEDADTLSADNVTVTAGGQGEITVVATEAGGTVEDEAVTVINDGGITGIDVGDSQVTDEDGDAVFEFTESDPGTYTLEFEAEDDSVTETVTVTVEEDEEVVASASANTYTPSIQSDGETRDVRFQANRSQYPGENPTFSWSWEEDGTEETATGEVHETTFTVPETVTVELEVSAQGKTDTDTVNLTVEDSLTPDARLDVPEAVKTDESVTFDASESEDNVEIAAYEWDFGNGTTASGSDLDTTDGSYAEPGVYDIELTVVDTSGNEDTNTTALTVEGANATIPDTPLEFDDVGNGSTASTSIPVENDGTAPLEFTADEISGENASAFDVTGVTELVGAGDVRDVDVTFSPTEAEDKTAELELETNSTREQTVTIDLSGTGVESDLVPEESSIDFGDVDVGDQQEREVTIENDGADSATITDVTLGDDDFELVGTPGEIDAGESATVTVAFEPETDGAQSTTLRIEGDDDTAAVSLTGTGLGPEIRLETDDLEFDTTGIDTTTTDTIEIRNTGSQDLDIEETTVTGSDEAVFTVVDEPDVITTGESEPVEIRFEPEEPVEHAASLVIEHNDTAAGEQTIGLSGDAVAAEISVDRTTVDFGETEIDESYFETVFISNDGRTDANLTVDDLRLVGANSEAFDIESPDAPLTLEPGDEQEIELNLTTQVEEPRRAQLQIRSDAGNQPLANVWLSNTRGYIIVQEISNPTVNIDGDNLEEGSEHLINVSTPSTQASNVTIDELGMTTERSDFEMNLSNAEEPFDTEFDADDDTALLQYVELDHIEGDPDVTFDDTAVHYRVNVDAVPDEAAGEDVTLHRYNDSVGEWAELDAQFLEERGSHYHYEVETPGFSEFAVTAPEPTDPSSSPSASTSSSPSPEPDPESNITVTGAVLGEATMTEGETATVTVTLENDGDADGEHTLELTADGTALVTESVAVDADETTNATLSFTPAVGEYDLEIDGQDVETLVVESDPADDDDGVTGDDDGVTGDDDPADDSDEEGVGTADDDGTSSWILLLLGALGAIVLLFVLLWRRREGEDETDGQSSTE